MTCVIDDFTNIVNGMGRYSSHNVHCTYFDYSRCTVIGLIVDVKEFVDHATFVLVDRCGRAILMKALRNDLRMAMDCIKAYKVGSGLSIWCVVENGWILMKKTWDCLKCAYILECVS
jgi:hypothetical protein